MASIADERLERLGVVDGVKVTPATIRVVDVAGTGPRSSAGCARWMPSSPSRTATRPAPIRPDLETLDRLLVADRDHVERRLEAREQASEVGRRGAARGGDELQALLAHLEAGNSLRDFPGELPPELEPLTTKPLLAIENGPGGIDLQLEAELAEMSEEEAAEFREGSALDEVGGGCGTRST